jgi:hypothetical protein
MLPVSGALQLKISGARWGEYPISSAKGAYSELLESRGSAQTRGSKQC